MGFELSGKEGDIVLPFPKFFFGLFCLYTNCLVGVIQGTASDDEPF